MKISKIVSLSAVSAAFAVLFLVLGTYVDVLDLSCLFMTSVVLMLPLTKGYRMGCFLAYLATALLAMILTGFRFQIIVPFVMFFGLHPLVNDLIKKFRINAVLAAVFKSAWFVATLYVMYYLMRLFADIPDFIHKYIHYFLIIGGVLIFLCYDAAIRYFQKAADVIIEKRLKL